MSPLVDPSVYELDPHERLPEWAIGLFCSPDQDQHANPTSQMGLDQRMGLELAELTQERCVGRMPVAGNTQPMGLWHGGASGVLVESLASLAALVHARAQDKVVVGVDLSVTHHRSVREGFVTGCATPLHLGRTLTTHQVQLFDDADRLVATGRLTCQLVAGPRVRDGRD